MALESPRLLIFYEASPIADSLLDILKEDQVTYHRATTVKAMGELLLGENFDLFIHIPLKSPQNFNKYLPAFARDLSASVSWYIGRPENKPEFAFDFITSEQDLATKDQIRTYLSNVLNITKKQKSQVELSSMLLHDLRSPTQSILGYLELLEKEVFGEINEGQHQILNNAIALGDSIIDLMEELGQVYQFEKNQFELYKSKIHLRQLIDETLRTLWVQADRKNIKFVPQIVPDLPDIVADSHGLQRVLTNLLTNAIQYSPEKGTVRIVAKTKTYPSGQKCIQFRIIDSGPGIPSDHLNSIFDKYYRIQDRKRKQKGHGLGLYISRLIVEAHNGQIGAYNNREGGSTLYFTLPLPEPKENS